LLEFLSRINYNIYCFNRITYGDFNMEVSNPWQNKRREDYNNYLSRRSTLYPKQNVYL